MNDPSRSGDLINLSLQCIGYNSTMRFKFSIIHLLAVTLLACIFLTAMEFKPRTKWERMDVGKSFDRLKAVVSKYSVHDARLELSPAAPKSLIAKARRINPEIPEQLFELLDVCDYSASAFFSDIEPVSVLKIPDLYRQESRIHRQDIGASFEGWNRDTYGCCKLDQAWRDGWIPIGNLHGHAIFLDMDPSENGVPGQVVELSIDWWGPEVLGYSIAHWLERVAEQCENEPDYVGPVVSTDFVELPPPRE